MKCQYCGKEVDPTFEFCDSCGNLISHYDQYQPTAKPFNKMEFSTLSTNEKIGKVKEVLAILDQCYCEPYSSSEVSYEMHTEDKLVMAYGETKLKMALDVMVDTVMKQGSFYTPISKSEIYEICNNPDVTLEGLIHTFKMRITPQGAEIFNKQLAIFKKEYYIYHNRVKKAANSLTKHNIAHKSRRTEARSYYLKVKSDHSEILRYRDTLYQQDLDRFYNKYNINPDQIKDWKKAEEDKQKNSNPNEGLGLGCCIMPIIFIMIILGSISNFIGCMELVGGGEEGSQFFTVGIILLIIVGVVMYLLSIGSYNEQMIARYDKISEKLYNKWGMKHKT